MNRRQVIFNIFGLTTLCPSWLEKLLLSKHDTQIKETERFDASAKGIVERILKGSDDIDECIKISDSFCDYSESKNDYFRGVHNGLLFAQAQLTDSEYKPL